MSALDKSSRTLIGFDTTSRDSNLALIDYARRCWKNPGAPLPAFG